MSHSKFKNALTVLQLIEFSNLDQETSYSRPSSESRLIVSSNTEIHMFPTESCFVGACSRRQGLAVTTSHFTSSPDLTPFLQQPSHYRITSLTT
jgi:hypothetical protein